MCFDISQHQARVVKIKVNQFSRLYEFNISIIVNYSVKKR